MWTFAVLVAGLALYVLSAGPSAWLMGRCGFPTYLLVPYEVIYKPLELVQERLPPEINRPYERYMNWWLAAYLPPPAMPTSPVPPVAAPASEIGRAHV